MKASILHDRVFWKDTMRISVPVVIQNLLTNSFSLIDTLMVSRLGEDVLSATGMATQWSTVLLWMMIGVGAALSVFVAQYWGVGDRGGIRRVFGMSLFGGILCTLVFLLPAALAPSFVVRLFNKDAGIVALGTRYLSVACWSYPAIMLQLLLSSLLRSTEEVRVPMYASSISAVLNVVLNYCLIFGKLGFPALDVRGAAIATVISSWCAPLIMLAAAVKKGGILHAPLRSMFAFTRAQVGEFLRRAAPVMANNAGWSFGMTVLTMIYSNLGSDYYAAVTIQKTLGDFIFACYLGFGNASIVLVGRDVGAGQIAQAKRNALRYTLLVMGTALLVGLGMAIFRRPLITLFNLGGDLSETAYQTALVIVAFYGIAQPIRSIAYIQIDGVFRSGGDTVAGAILDTASLWVCSVPVALLAAHVWHLPFVWVFILSVAAEDIPKGIACFVHFFSEKWLKPVTPEGIAGLEAYRAAKNK